METRARMPLPHTAFCPCPCLPQAICVALPFLPCLAFFALCPSCCVVVVFMGELARTWMGTCLACLDTLPAHAHLPPHPMGSKSTVMGRDDRLPQAAYPSYPKPPFPTLPHLLPYQTPTGFGLDCYRFPGLNTGAGWGIFIGIHCHRLALPALPSHFLL